MRVNHVLNDNISFFTTFTVLKDKRGCDDETYNEFLEDVHAEFSYFKPGFERTPMYRSGKWDGRKMLYHLRRRAWGDEIEIPSLLIPRFLSLVPDLDLYYKEGDHDTTGYRLSRTDSFQQIDLTLRAMEFPELRDYQLNALYLVFKQQWESGVLCMPTGAGKTRTALAYARLTGKSGNGMENAPRDVLIVVHRRELLNQWDAAIRSIWPQSNPLKINTKHNDVLEDPHHIRIHIAMVQTLNSKSFKAANPHDLTYTTVIFDECHIVPAESVYGLAQSIKAVYRLGLSATPTRGDNADLAINAVAGETVKVTDVETLVENGVLTKPVFITKSYQTRTRKPVYTWAEAYESGIVENVERNKAITDLAEQYMQEGRQVYIHVAHVRHGMILTPRISGAVEVYGTTKPETRDFILERFAKGEIRCLVSTLLKEGVDIGGISCLIYAAGGKSQVSVIQTIGRAMRPDPEFKDAIIIDFEDTGKWLNNHYRARAAAIREAYAGVWDA